MVWYRVSMTLFMSSNILLRQVLNDEIRYDSNDFIYIDVHKLKCLSNIW